MAIAGVCLQSKECYRYAYPELQKLSFKYSVHGHMGGPRKTDIVHLISSCCEQTMDLLIPMGHRHPMFCSAMGRAILAYLPAAKSQEILKQSNIYKYSVYTKTEKDEIQEELLKTRKNGYCLLMNELVEGKGSIAAPIFDRNRRPVAAISISAGAGRLSNEQQVKELAKGVTGAAARISSKMGYYPR